MAKEFKNVFAVREIYKDTYCIMDNAMNPVNLYLLVGQERAALIDSGYGNPLLRDTVRKLTDKPVFCICTHGHIDHANGASLFEEAYLHSKDFDLYKEHSAKEFIIHSGYEGSGKKPTKLLRMPGYKENIHFLANLPRRALTPLDDIPAFDLGGRVLTWTPVPGHTQGSIAVLDEANHAAFDGDAAGQGPWVFLPESSPLEEYAETIRRYRELLTAKGITQHYVGHSKNGLPTAQIDKLCAVCDYAVARRYAGKRCGIPVHLGAGDAVFIYKNHNAVFAKP